MPLNPSALPSGVPPSAGPWLIPRHSRIAINLPWPYCLIHEHEKFIGMWGDKMLEFIKPGKPRAMVWSSDADIDIDGPGGSKATDKYWQPETSLRWPDRSSVDSRAFPGIVVPPPVEKEFGVRIGDYGAIIWAGQLCYAQVYDVGPTAKIGELSIFLGRQCGLVTPEQSDYHAATKGNSATDLFYLIFPGSGPGHAVENDQILREARTRLGQLEGA